MRFGIVVDSACDLPAEFFAEHDIGILPISIRIGEETLVDNRDPTLIARYLAENLGARGAAAETEPYTVEQVRDVFLERLVIDYDCVFCLTITSTRSPIFEHARKASFAILNSYQAPRKAAGVDGPFLMRVIDGQTLFAGQGVAVYEATQLIAANASVGAMRERLEFIAQNSYGYMLPRDLYYLRARAQKKGDRSVGLLSAALGSALDIKPILRGWRGETGPVGKVRGFDAGAKMLFAYTQARVRAGLLVPVLCVSYGGDLAELAALPGYAALKETCAEHGIQVLESPMSVTGMVNVGVGAVTLGFAALEHDAKF
ncbi:DegV family protein [Rudaea sp.]|uniref:DegV family protein n=1 Tax=Rudaea sp. TaxID=2136325 RepID=UPI002ED016D5